MNIKIDGNNITVNKEYVEKNIVEIANSIGIIIPAPCYFDKIEGYCCKVCVIFVNSKIVQGCDTYIEEGMEIITEDKQLEKIRKENLSKYRENLKNINITKNNCYCKCNSNNSHCCGNQ